jgi:predicted RNA-binding protein
MIGLKVRKFFKSHRLMIVTFNPDTLEIESIKINRPFVGCQEVIDDLWEINNIQRVATKLFSLGYSENPLDY